MLPVVVEAENMEVPELGAHKDYMLVSGEQVDSNQVVRKVVSVALSFVCVSFVLVSLWWL